MTIVAAVPNAEQVQNIPLELRQLRQWITRRADKTPTDWRTGNTAAGTNPSNWGQFDEVYSAAKRFGQGIGFSFANGYCGIDLDHCIGEDGAWSEIAQDVVKYLDSYTELSPSGTGLHIIVRAKLPGAIKRDKIEMYDTGRYFTVTGDRTDAAPSTVQERQEAVNRVYERFKGHSQGTPVDSARRVHAAIVLSDEEISARILASSQGEKFKRLCAGDLSDYTSEAKPLGDHSAADMALCSILAFWLDCDAGWIDGRVRGTKLMRPKWDEVHGGDSQGKPTYGQMTIQRAINSTVATYRHHGFEIRDDATLWHVGKPSKGKTCDTDEPEEHDIAEGRTTAVPFFVRASPSPVKLGTATPQAGR